MVRRSRALAWIVPFLLLLAWEGAVRAQLVPPSQAAKPSDVIVRLCRLAESGTLFRHAGFSVFRIVFGVAMGALVAVVSSVSLARSRVADELLSPMVHLLAGVPVVVWIPFWVMMFGTGELFKIGMAGISTYFLVHMQTFQAIRSVEKDYAELADIYEKTHWQRVFDVLLPFATPAIFTALRTSLAFAWVVIFFVEYASAKHGSEGLGWFIADARAIGRIEDEFAGLFFLGTIAYVSDRMLGLIQRRLLVWSNTQDDAT